MLLRTSTVMQEIPLEASSKKNETMSRPVLVCFGAIASMKGYVSRRKMLEVGKALAKMSKDQWESINQLIYVGMK
jgi:hypothetical protein